MISVVNLLLLVVYSAIPVNSERYQPTWDSLDKRPIPTWYDQSKFGIFINWGIYSVPSYGSEWFWFSWKGSKSPKIVKFMEDNYKPSFTYPDFAAQLTAEFYDPDQWADIFKASKAKYIVFDSKHHEGFTMWPSNTSFNWNSMDVGPKRDLLGDLANSIRKRAPEIHFGVYHSLFEWFNPVYLKDKANHFQTQTFVESKTMPELYDLVKTYRPEVIWSDGQWEAPSSYWNSTEFIAWLYNDSPVKDTVVVNDRWGSETTCKHGDFYTCSDRYNPKSLQKHKWENAMTIDKASWGFRRDAQLADYLEPGELVTLLAETVSCGGNLLMNIGPTKDGRIIPVYEERLRQMGEWLGVNGEAIFNTAPWTNQNDSITNNVWYTYSVSTKSVYAIVLQWPEKPLLSLGSVSTGPNTTVSLLGYPSPISWQSSTPGPGGYIEIRVPVIPANRMPCQWGWVFAMKGVMGTL